MTIPRVAHLAYRAGVRFLRWHEARDVPGDKRVGRRFWVRMWRYVLLELWMFAILMAVLWGDHFARLLQRR